MSDLTSMMVDELVTLQRDITAELSRRSQEKKIPVFGVRTSPLRVYEFSDLHQAISCAEGLLGDVLIQTQEDMKGDGLQGWNGDLLRVYVQHVSESDFAILKPHLKDQKL